LRRAEDLLHIDDAAQQTVLRIHATARRDQTL
jgi:hypothetical protein